MKELKLEIELLEERIAPGLLGSGLTIVPPAGNSGPLGPFEVNDAASAAKCADPISVSVAGSTTCKG